MKRELRTTVVRDGSHDPRSGLYVGDLHEVVTRLEDLGEPVEVERLSPGERIQILGEVHRTRLELARLPRPEREATEARLAGAPRPTPAELAATIRAAIESVRPATGA